MKNKRRYSVNYVPVKNVRSSGNSIIHRWISMLMTGIFEETAGGAVEFADGGRGCVFLREGRKT